MDTTHLPVTELQRLLSRVSEHGSQHLHDAEDDLEQTLFLLEQAIKTLSGAFMQISQLVSLEQKTVDGLLAKHGVATNQTDLPSLRERIDQEVNTAITGLQFQDLTSQLITRSMKRISGLRDLLTVLANHGNDSCSILEYESAEQLLKEMHHSLSEKSGAIKDGLRQEVKQKHMVSGDIEFF